LGIGKLESEILDELVIVITMKLSTGRLSAQLAESISRRRA
jgi:hypothetical protein